MLGLLGHPTTYRPNIEWIGSLLRKHYTESAVLAWLNALVCNKLLTFDLELKPVSTLRLFDERFWPVNPPTICLNR